MQTKKYLATALVLLPPLALFQHKNSSRQWLKTQVIYITFNFVLLELKKMFSAKMCAGAKLCLLAALFYLLLPSPTFATTPTLKEDLNVSTGINQGVSIEADVNVIWVGSMRIDMNGTALVIGG